MVLTRVSNNPDNLPYAQILNVAIISNTMQIVYSKVIEILIQCYGDTMVIIFITV